MFASIVIPTYNRLFFLAKVLDALKFQDFPCSRYEIIIVDDGSLTPFSIGRRYRPLQIRMFRQKHKGAAAARNLGIKNASGDLVLFLGDDIIPTPRLVRVHVEKHKKENGIAVVGHIDWYPKAEITDFMRWLAPNGSQFNFRAIKNPANCGFSFFYTSNISLNRKWLKDDRFDEGFESCGWEDLELGYRLERKGLRLIYEPFALGFHYHPQNFEDYLRKFPSTSRNAIYFAKKHSDLEFRVIGYPRLHWYFFSLASLLLGIERFKKDWFWFIVSRKEKWRQILIELNKLSIHEKR